MSEEKMSPNQWADFWRYIVGVNVIPANNLTKRPKVVWKQWQTEPVPEELFKEWKEKRLFDQGIAIVCGQVFHNEIFKDLWLNAIDSDNKAGTNAMCPQGVAHTAKETLVEQHSNPDKCHILFYTKEPLKNRALDLNSECQVEVKSMGKNLLYCSGCLHKDGTLIDIVGTEKIKTVDKIAIEGKLDEILGTPARIESAKTVASTKTTTKSELSKLNVGDNRQGAIFSKLGTYFAKIPQDEITQQDCINKAVGLNNECGTSYEQARAVTIGEDFFKMRMSDDDKKEKPKLAHHTDNDCVDVTTKEAQGDMKEINNTVHKIDDKTTYRLTDEEEKTLRPITVDNENEKLILVYLNADVEVVERKTETQPMAFFVVNGKNGKALVLYDNSELQSKYSSNIFKKFKSLVGRWKNSDIQAYLNSDTKISPKDLFENLLSLERQYFENPYNYDYFYEVCWKVHTYFYPLFALTPYNDYTGMKNIGKSKRLKLNKMICYNAWSSDDSSSSALFRTTEGTGATMLLDEVEKLGSSKTDNKDLQTILRGGNQKDHYVTKAVEVRGEWTPVAFDLFSPKAFGHINPIDNVLQDRCITTKLYRTNNTKIANSEPDEEENPLISQCREGCYRLFLDYGLDVKSLILEAKKLFADDDVSGRERNLWLPIVTVALFFEKHGIVDLVNKMMSKLAVNSEEKKTKDAEQNDEVKILTVLLETDPQNIPTRSRSLYSFINKGLYDIYNLEAVNDVSLCNYLENLGFTPRRDSKGTHWINITAVKISEAKQRCGMIKETQATLGDSVSSVGSVS